MIAVISPPAPVVAAPPAPSPAQRATPARAPQLMRRCDGACSCGGSCGDREEVERDGKLARLLQASVQERALQRMPTEAQAGAGLTRLDASGPLLQRRCSREQLRNLQRDMHAACDSGISCRGNFSCGQLYDRYDNAFDCLNLRQRIQSQCYNNQTDAGHAEIIDSVNSAIDFCERKLDLQDC